MREIKIPKGYTIEKALEECRKLFPVSAHAMDDIVSDRDSKEAYSVFVKDTVEADEELKNLSADDLKEKGVKGITLLERLKLELDYFKETGKHLDIKNMTLCSGSRDAVGRVPSVRWDPDYRRVRVHWDHPDYRLSALRSRAVSLKNA
jgi:hypothetical protein